MAVVAAKQSKRRDRSKVLVCKAQTFGFGVGDAKRKVAGAQVPIGCDCVWRSPIRVGLTCNNGSTANRRGSERYTHTVVCPHFLPVALSLAVAPCSAWLSVCCRYGNQWASQIWPAGAQIHGTEIVKYLSEKSFLVFYFGILSKSVLASARRPPRTSHID